MRFLVKVKAPVGPLNKAIQEGTLRTKIQAILTELKPEAAYFLEEGGHRTAVLIVLCLFSAVSLLWSAPRHRGGRASSDGDSTLVEQTIRRLEQEWAQASAKGDAATIDRIEASDFVFTMPGGTVENKTEDISDAKNGNFKADAIDEDDLKVRVYGSTAIVVGRVTIRNGKWKGQDVSGAYRFTDVFVEMGGRWQAVASEATSIHGM